MVDLPDLTRHLKDLSKLRGQFMWTQEAMNLYDDWYREFDSTEFEDDTGMLERLGESVLKVALLISLSRDTSLQLRYEDVAEGIASCERFVPGSKKVTLGAAGKSSSREGTAVVLRHLLQVKETSKIKMLQRFWGHFNADELQVILDSLKVARAIKVEQRRTGDGPGLGVWEEWVILNPQVAANYERLKKED